MTFCLAERLVNFDMDWKFKLGDICLTEKAFPMVTLYIFFMPFLMLFIYILIMPEAEFNHNRI